MNKYIISLYESNQRLDKVITLLNNSISRTFALKLIEEGNVLVNDKKEKPSYKTKIDDVIFINIPAPKELKVEKEDIPLDIVYEDKDILIINKPQGMVVHPSFGHFEHTLVNAILAHCNDLSGIGGVLRPGIVHRIDKDTSGLICIAKNDAAHNYLSEQLKSHTMKREYIALVRGIIYEDSGQIDMPIARDASNRQKMAISKVNSKQAITNFTVIERFKEHTLIRCSLLTGRTHQIRVHMKAINHPVEGDPLYCGKNYDKLYKNGQLLSAVKLTLIHPTTKKEMSFNCDIPNYFKQILLTLK